MGARTKARKRALDVLFEAEQRAVDPAAVLARVAAAATSPINPYTAVLVDGVVEHGEHIDELIATYSQGWSLERMPAVDRNLLRIAVFELLHSTEVPTDVVIDEAVGLAGELSTDDSPSFVNGLLGRIAAVQGRVSGGTD